MNDAASSKIDPRTEEILFHFEEELKGSSDRDAVVEGAAAIIPNWRTSFAGSPRSSSSFSALRPEKSPAVTVLCCAAMAAQSARWPTRFWVRSAREEWAIASTGRSKRR